MTRLSNLININQRFIGKPYRPFIIAEMSGNHNHSLERALKIVDAAAECGVDALKIQTYTADTMTLNLNTNEFSITDNNSLWKGRSLYDLYKEAYTPWEWHKPIMDRCHEKGIIFFSTPFDETAVDFLEDLGVLLYKVASFENTDIKLIEKIAKTQKPVIISTGMASIAELDDIVQTMKKQENDKLIFLKCTSAYPATAKEANLKTISHLQNMFNVNVGLSDHTMGIGVSLASIPLGATVIEKHFTLSRSDGGVDSAFSMEPAEMKLLVDESLKAWEAIGEISYIKSKSEQASAKFKRSLYITKDLKSGEILSKDNIKAVRPGFGLSTKYYDHIIGRKVTRDVKKGTPVSWDLI